MKIAVITANLGNIDPVHSFPKQDCECDRYYITDETKVYPFTDVNDRLAGKWFKMCSHKIFPNYDAFLWIDGNVKIKSTSFVSKMVAGLKGGEVVITRHQQRKTIGEEVNFICDQIDKGNSYLKARYTKEGMQKELSFINNNDLPLYWCGMFLRLNNPRVNEMFESWFDGQVLFQAFDQTLFSNYAQYMHIRTVDLGPFYDNDYYTLIKHNK